MSTNISKGSTSYKNVVRQEKLMEYKLEKLKHFLNQRNLIILNEILIFFSILTFSILLFITHPPSMVCIIEDPKTWVLVFTIVISIFNLFPLFTYNLKNRKSVSIKNIFNLIRIGTIIIFFISIFVYSLWNGCHVYRNLYLYFGVILLTLVFPILVRLR